MSGLGGGGGSSLTRLHAAWLLFLLGASSAVVLFFVPLDPRARSVGLAVSVIAAAVGFAAYARARREAGRDVAARIARLRARRARRERR